MKLCDVVINKSCIIKKVEVGDEKIRTRLMELGMIKGCEILVKKRSVLKKTLLVVFNSVCFTIKSNIAKEIVVVYA